jgi:AcrR family transcriptional regulator
MRTLDPEAHARVRGRILEAARRVFAEKGYHASSMNEVAKAAGLTKAAVYHYFEGKAELLREMHLEVERAAAANLDLEHAPKDFRSALIHLGNGYFEHFRKGGPADQLMLIAMAINPEDPFMLKESAGNVPELVVKLNRYVEDCAPKEDRGSVFERRLMPFFGALFYYRYVLQTFVPENELPGREAFVANLAEIFSAPLSRQKAAMGGSLCRAGSSRLPRPKAGVSRGKPS